MLTGVRRKSSDKLVNELVFLSGMPLSLRDWLSQYWAPEELSASRATLLGFRKCGCHSLSSESSLQVGSHQTVLFVYLIRYL